jgi:tRNA-specific 2-thiouridylase
MAAMSGGVDSSVAAALLKNEGHDVTGVTMTVWDGGAVPGRGDRHGCYGPEEEDLEDARRVARTLEIPFHVVDLRKEYRTEVLDYVRQEYLSGRTPNPCVRCNRKVKLDSLVARARESGIDFDCVATGHYARVDRDEGSGRFLLKRAKDEKKDQTYFLSALSQEQLACTLFPLGVYTKTEVRKMASDLALPVGDKPESQDFVTGGYSFLLEAAVKSGPIMDRAGNVLGEHRGIPFYTIGQRKGLGLSRREPLYVTEIEPARNALLVGTRDEVYGRELTCSGLNWIATDVLNHPARVTAKIRSKHEEAAAVVTPLGGDKAHVRFEEPQMAITKGQTVVFYDGEVVLGSGTIDGRTD